MLEIFKLVGRVMVDSSDADQSLDATGKKAEDTTGAIGEYAQKLQNWAAGLLTVSSVVAGLKKVWEVSSQVAELGDTIDKSSQKFLMSTYTYQKWSFFAEHLGFDISAVGNAINDLAKDVGSGAEETLAALEELGISAAEAMTATPEDLFEMVIAGLQGMENSTRRAYLADKLLHGASKDLVTAFNATGEELDNLEDQMNKLGGTMSQDLIDKSAAYKDASANLQTAWQGVKNNLAEKTVPAMTEIVNGLTKMLTGDFVDGLKTAADGVKGYFAAIVGSFSDTFAPAVEDFVVWVSDKLSWIPGFETVTQEDINAYKKGAEEGKTWWEVAGYIANPAVTAGNDWEGRSMGLPTVDVGELALGAYAYIAKGGNKWDYLDDIENKYGTATLDETYDALDRLNQKIADFTAAGGDISDFWDEMRELYGSAVDDAAAATADISTKTEEYASAMEDGAAAWRQAQQDYATANSNAVGRINAAAEQFVSGLLGGSYYSSGFGGMRHAHANGIPFVPRDNYPSQLHYGERVLTRQENEEYSRGEGKGGDTTINIQTVAQSPAQTAAAITAALARARWAM